LIFFLLPFFSPHPFCLPVASLPARFDRPPFSVSILSPFSDYPAPPPLSPLIGGELFCQEFYGPSFSSIESPHTLRSGSFAGAVMSFSRKIRIFVFCLLAFFPERYFHPLFFKIWTPNPLPVILDGRLVPFPPYHRPSSCVHIS